MAQDKKKSEGNENKITREYTIPLRKKTILVPRYKKANRAVKAIKEFLVKHMKVRDRDTSKVRLDKYINEYIWYRGIKKPPAKVKVTATKDNTTGIVHVELVNIPDKLKHKKNKEEKEHKEAQDKAEKKKQEQQSMAQKAQQTMQAKGKSSEESKEQKSQEKQSSGQEASKEQSSGKQESKETETKESKKKTTKKKTTKKSTKKKAAKKKEGEEHTKSSIEASKEMEEQKAQEAKHRTDPVEESNRQPPTGEYQRHYKR